MIKIFKAIVNFVFDIRLSTASYEEPPSRRKLETNWISQQKQGRGMLE
jgi:hypothetical protein